MRIDLHNHCRLDFDEELKVFEKAKELMEKHGNRDYVVEIRQATCMGGIRYVLTHQDELDKGYIGYRGFIPYSTVCQEIEAKKKMGKRVETEEELEKWKKLMNM